MSLRTFGQRSFNARTFEARTWTGGGVVVITDPSQAGWITRTANRLSVLREAQRVAMFLPQQRVWIARSDNE